MSEVTGRRLTRASVLGAAVGIALLLGGATAAAASAALRLVSSDPYTNTTSYHATEVEPDTFAFGTTIVSAFQAGRFEDGGASNIGWSTSANDGGSWTQGFLPGTTAFATPAGPYARESDPAVAYDSSHKVWLLSGLAVSAQTVGVAVIVNRSTNGGTVWTGPVTVAAATSSQFFDKDWITCDNTATSPHFGSCYAEWDDAANGNRLHMAYSRDGGLTWSQSTVPAAGVIGGQPLAQPNGHVVVPIDNASGTVLESFVSTNGGVSYTGPTTVASVTNHVEAGNLRSGALPSAAIDQAGRIYVAWADCRFRAGCSANDIVAASSADGIHWTTVRRVPIDATASTVDHFLPGLGVAANTSGTGTKLALTYYYYPNTSCTASTCRLDVGFVRSSNQGASWTTPIQLAGPTSLDELPLTNQGYMVGDYISTSLLTGFAGDPAMSVFAVGQSVAGKTCTLGSVGSCNEPMMAPASGPSGSAATVPTLPAPVLSRGSGRRATAALTAF